MEAIHVRTSGFYCNACPRVVEKAVGTMPGVTDVIAVRSMNLTSILYDPDLVDAEALCARIRRAGFGAHICRQNPEPCPGNEPAGSST